MGIQRQALLPVEDIRFQDLLSILRLGKPAVQIVAVPDGYGQFSR